MDNKGLRDLRQALAQLQREGAADAVSPEDDRLMATLRAVLLTGRALPELSDEEAGAVAELERRAHPANEDSLISRLQTGVTGAATRDTVLGHWKRIGATFYDLAGPRTVSAILRQEGVTTPDEPEKIETAIERVRRRLDEEEVREG